MGSVRFPPAAGLLVAVTAAVHAIDFLAGGALLRAGANSSAVWDGEAYRLLSAVFLHINLPHLLVNMSGLYLFGRVVEAAVGPRRFLGVYLISGLTGSVVSLLAAPGAQAAGASGAIFGLVGWVLHFRLRRLERRWLPIDSILIQILVLNVLLALVLPNLDHAGHLGGLAGGALAGSLL